MGSLLGLLLLLPAPELPAPDPVEDRLGPIVVEATPADDDEPIPLPILEVGTSGPRASATLPWFRTLRRDLELYGGFDVREDPVDPDGAWLKGAAAGVELQGLEVDGGAQVVARVLDDEGNERWRKPLTLTPKDDRDAHALTDAVLEAVTGLRGGFASRLAFARTVGTTRRVYALDVDGGNIDIVSGDHELALSPTFDHDGRVVYASSVENGRYRIRVAGTPDETVDLGGSVYGIAFSRDGNKVAVTVARGSGIALLVGTSRFRGLSRASKVGLAMHPAFGPGGRLAYVGESGKRPRIFVDRRIVSGKGVSASAPEFCNHPDRPRLLWAERVGRRWVLVRADARGRGARRISWGWGDARWPACSPDGRMVAFVSSGRTRRPGLYITHVDHFSPRRISSMVGSSLHWSGWR